jgi:membrane protein implicated in regulation of membrane protease activity
MIHRRDLFVANLAAVVVLLVVLLLGWWEAAAFGLAVLMLLDLMVVLRGRQARAEEAQMGVDDRAGDQRGEEPMIGDWPVVTYEQALAAYEAGEKLHRGGRIYLVRRALREPEEGLVLWLADERTLGDHGLLLFPDGRTETK